MHEALTIEKETSPEGLQLHIAGRIDAYWSRHLDEALDEVMRSGHRNISLDLENVSFLSSPGIRVLIRVYKLLKQTGGRFYISRASANINATLKMVGLESLINPGQAERIPDNQPSWSVIRDEDMALIRCLRLNDCKAPGIIIYGEPEKLDNIGFNENDCRQFSFGGDIFGLGLGAFGQDFDDCRERFGEFIGLGQAVACLPSDRPKHPDYLLRTGNMIPEIQVLYGLFFRDHFNYQLQFSSKDDQQPLSFSTILDSISKLTGDEPFTLVMLAETTGMVGASLSHSPASPGPAGTMFGFPEVRDHMAISTEPEFAGSLVLVAGIAAPHGEDVPPAFTRPENEKTGRHAHFHAAIFRYYPVSWEKSEPAQVIRTLFSEGHLLHVMHLLHDDREGNGAGESHFRRGNCWIGLPESYMAEGKGGNS